MKVVYTDLKDIKASSHNAGFWELGTCYCRGKIAIDNVLLSLAGIVLQVFVVKENVGLSFWESLVIIVDSVATLWSRRRQSVRSNCE